MSHDAIAEEVGDGLLIIVESTTDKQSFCIDIVLKIIGVTEIPGGWRRVESMPLDGEFFE